MEFHEAAGTLFDLKRYSQRPGTAATAALLEHLGNPEHDFDSIQIAGSNGKGSTARMLESVLSEAGLDVGLYTSPHMRDVRERIRVNERPISETSLIEFVERVGQYLTERASEDEPPTYFETLTAMALWEFGRQDIDVAILEVGIGGRLDATSAVESVAAAVTSITLEHTDVLGETVAEIARDKAAVASADRPLVTAATGDALDAIRDAVDDVVTVGTGEAVVDPTLRVDWRGRDAMEGVVGLAGDDVEFETRLGLLGPHQARNAGVAVLLARQVTDVSQETLATGLRKAEWPGRFEVVDRDPMVVLDGAHNPGGVEAVVETLESFEITDLHVVAGVMADKDVRGMARALSDVDHVVACHPNRARAEDETVVARAFERETAATVETRSDVAGAVDIALEAAGPEDCVLVVGSLYTVGEARPRWAEPVVPHRVDSLSSAREILEANHVTEAGTWRMRGKGVHRVLTIRVQPRQARYIKEELLSLGGECAISGLNDQDEEPVQAVLMATLAQFKRLTEKLQQQPYGLAPLARRIRHQLNIGVEPDRDAWPWTGPGTAVMGILNVTPDSFHDGGRFATTGPAVTRAQEMVAEGADVIDVGGESTRPGADPVSVEEERSRVVPVIEAIADSEALVSVDTRKPDVASAALAAGADILNDVTGLVDPAMRRLAAEFDVPVVLMHSIDAPVVPDRDVHYDDVVTDVIDVLAERVLLAERAGLDRSQILVDPGVGFGKSKKENFELLNRLDEFRALGCPILIGHSHKSMFSRVGRDAGNRTDPTIAASAIAAERGADVVRVHDVAANRAAVDVVAAAEHREALDR